MARFTEQSNIRRVNTETGQIQQTNSLLNRLTSFTDSAANLIQKEQVKSSVEEAQQVPLEKKDGLTQAPKKKEKGLKERLITGGVSVDAYNKTLETAYLAGLSNDTKNAIAKIEQENPNDTVAFNTQAQGYIKGLVENVDPAVQNQVAQFAQNQVANSQTRVHGRNIIKNKNEAIATSSEAITTFSNDAATLAREGNGTGAAESALQAYGVIDGMVEAGNLPTDKAAEMKREINREMTEQTIRRDFDTITNEQGLGAAFNKLEDMANKPAKGWTPDEWDSFIGSERADLRQKAIRRQQGSAKNSLSTAREVSNLKIKANTGLDFEGEAVEPSDIINETERLFNAGAITGNERSSIFTSIIKQQQETAKQTLMKQKVAARLGGANEIAISQQEVDLTWDEEISDEIDQLPPVLKNTAVSEFVNSTKIVPTQIINQVNSDLNSQDPELVSNAADLMDRLDSVRGIPQTNFSPTDRAFAENVVMLQKNLEPLEAIKLAKQNTDPNDKGRIEARQALIKSEKLSLDYPDIVENAFDPWFGSTSVNDVSKGQLTAEYGALFEAHFKAGMSEDRAKEKALQIIKRNWGETSVTGKKTAIKYPPEDYYSVNGSTDYIAKDLYTSVADAFVGLPEFKTENIQLISDQTTARQAAQGKPSYLVMIDGGEDGLLPLVGFRYQPNMQEEVTRLSLENESTMNESRAQSIEQKQYIDSVLNERVFNAIN